MPAASKENPGGRRGALIVGIDRFMSETRALTSLVVAQWEGACDRQTLQRELDAGFVELVPMSVSDAVLALVAVPD